VRVSMEGEETIGCRRTTVSSSGVHLIGMVAVVAVDAVKVVKGRCATRCKRNLRLVCCGCAAKPLSRRRLVMEAGEPKDKPRARQDWTRDGVGQGSEKKIERVA
jgi:hypothetical protein